MFISHIVGGLGNQMFVYAMAKSLASVKSAELKLDLSTFNHKKYINPEGYLLSKVFGVDEKEAGFCDYFNALGIKAAIFPLVKRRMISADKDVFLFEKEVFKFDDEYEKNEKLRKGYILGYWQTEKYFLKTEKEIRKRFEFNKSQISTRAIELADKIMQKNSVSVHIRRGDYISNPVYSKSYDFCGMDYYNAAFKTINSKVESPFYCIFTDDIEWTASQEIFKNALICSESGEGSWNDMYLMSVCKHHIIANSTFSWWGAWLNPNKNKIVVSPNSWFIDGRVAHDLIPKNWVTV